MKKWINWKTILSGVVATVVSGGLIWALGVAGDTVAECKKVEIYRGECIKTDERVNLIESEFRSDIKQIMVDNSAQKSDTKAIKEALIEFSKNQSAANQEFRTDIKELLREVRKNPHQ